MKVTIIFRRKADQKLEAIEIIKETLNIGLREAKEFYDEGGIIPNTLSIEQAIRFKERLEETGMRVEITEEE